MLKLSFLGYKTSFKAWYTHRGLVPALKERRYIQGWWAGQLLIIRIIQNAKIVIDKEKQKRREPMEDNYIGLTVNLASIKPCNVST
jgi:hypothetical protein